MTGDDARKPPACMARCAGGSDTRRPRVLFDCPAAHAMFDEDSTAGIGGAEFRAATFARGMAAMGLWDVQFALASPERRASEVHEGVRVHYDGGAGREATLRGRIARRAARLVGSLEQRCFGWPARRPAFPGDRPDVVATFGVSNRTAGVVRQARSQGQAVVLFITSDRTLEDLLRRGRRDRGLYGEIGSLCRYAVRNAHAIVAQTEYQSIELMTRANVPSAVIRNPIAAPATPDAASRPRETEEPYVLWVGRADNNSKRADIGLEIARRCPSQRFVFIMNRHDERLFSQYLLDCPGNATIVPHVPWRQMDHYYRHATWLMNTSNREGLPNAFLQAGVHGVPVLSLNADPDGMLSGKGGGVCTEGSVDRMVERLRSLNAGSGEHQRMSQRIRAYVLGHHGVEGRCRELAELLSWAWEGASRSPRWWMPADDRCTVRSIVQEIPRSSTACPPVGHVSLADGREAASWGAIGTHAIRHRSEWTR